MSERAMALEFIDRPDCDPALATASYRFMGLVNRWFGGAAVVRRFLMAEAAGRSSPLRVLDLGSGSCDIPLALSRWAGRAGIPIHFTCLETSETALAIARQRIGGTAPELRLLAEDAFSHHPAEPYDCAVASMFFHHLSDARILGLLERLRGFVRQSVLVNDLRRSPLAGLATRALLAATCAPAGVRHDALLSIQRGFQTGELDALLLRLGGAAVQVEQAPWFRVVAVVRFRGENQ